MTAMSPRKRKLGSPNKRRTPRAPKSPTGYSTDRPVRRAVMLGVRLNEQEAALVEAHRRQGELTSECVRRLLISAATTLDPTAPSDDDKIAAALARLRAQKGGVAE